MNELISKLFKQSGGIIEIENGNFWTYSDDLDPELFAKLIVKECIDVVSKATASPNGYQALMKHFGVEE